MKAGSEMALPFIALFISLIPGRNKIMKKLLSSFLLMVLILAHSIVYAQTYIIPKNTIGFKSFEIIEIDKIHHDYGPQHYARYHTAIVNELLYHSTSSRDFYYYFLQDQAGTFIEEKNDLIKLNTLDWMYSPVNRSLDAPKEDKYVQLWFYKIDLIKQNSAK
jgi:hypothetical protein